MKYKELIEETSPVYEFHFSCFTQEFSGAGCIEFSKLDPKKNHRLLVVSVQSLRNKKKYIFSW